jgi:hypothetical protein
MVGLREHEAAGKRQINILPWHSERCDALTANIVAARQQLVATKRAFLAGVVIEDGRGRHAAV